MTEAPALSEPTLEFTVRATHDRCQTRSARRSSPTPGSASTSPTTWSSSDVDRRRRLARRPRQALRAVPLDPAAAVLHYAQEIFEGLKAYRHADGSIWTFRPEANAARFARSARRLALPELPAGRLHRVARAAGRGRPGVGAAASRRGRASTCGRSCSPRRRSSACARPARSPTRVIASPGRRLLHRRRQAGLASGSRATYARAGAGGTGAAKCGGNYAASLAAQVEASEHGCDQVVFLDAVEHR